MNISQETLDYWSNEIKKAGESSSKFFHARQYDEATKVLQTAQTAVGRLRWEIENSPANSGMRNPEWNKEAIKRIENMEEVLRGLLEVVEDAANHYRNIPGINTNPTHPMTTIAKIMETRRIQKEAENKKAQEDKNERLATRKTYISKITEFLEETGNDPKFGPLLEIKIDPNYQEIRISPSKLAYERIEAQTTESIDDLDWPDQMIRMAQVDPIGGEPPYLTLVGSGNQSSVDQMLDTIQYEVATLLETIMEFLKETDSPE